MRFWYNPNFLAITALLFLSIPALKSLATPGFYTSHDGETHTARIAQYYQALKDGQYPPRFAGSFYNGLGSPLFVYIYPLPYFLGSLIHSLGFSFTDSFKILMVAAYLSSAIFSYLWLKAVFKSEKAAFLGALFYIWVPYRFLLLYVRASLSELLAYSFLPLLFFALTRMVETKKPAWLPVASISYALLLLSQNLAALVCSPVLVGYLLVLSIYRRSYRILFQGLLSLIWGFIIAAFTYLPSLFERQFTRLDEIINIAYQNHFAALKQLIRSPWGYGFDLPGTVNDQLSLQIGLAQLLILPLILMVILLRLPILKKIKSHWQDIVLTDHIHLTFYFLLIFGAAVFLMVNWPPTIYVWQNFAPLRMIDIPWRLLGIAALATSFLAAYAAWIFKPGLIFLILTLAVLVANRNHLRINQQIFYDDQFFSTYKGTATQYSEFTPVWRDSTSISSTFNQLQPLTTVSGEVRIWNMLAKSNGISFEADVTSEETEIRINKFYFPKVTIVDKQNELRQQQDWYTIRSDDRRLNQDQDNSGLILLTLKKGSHDIIFEYRETILRKLANLLSLGSLLLVVVVTFRYAYKKQ